MKFGLIISKQHPPGVSMVECFREHIEQVRAARDAGFDLIVMGQPYLSTPFQEIQTLPSLARLAAEAGSTRVGAIVFLRPLHNHVDVAERVATMDVIRGGRLSSASDSISPQKQRWSLSRAMLEPGVPRGLSLHPGVQDQEELAHRSCYGHLLGFPSPQPSVRESFANRVTPCRAERGHG